MNYLKKTKTHLPIVALLFLSCSVAYTQNTETSVASAPTAGGGDMLAKIHQDLENIEKYFGFSLPPEKTDTNKPPTLEFSSKSNQLIKKDDQTNSSSATFMSTTPENSATANLFSTFSANSTQP